MMLSAVISTYNRAESLKRTLESVRKLADEIIVVDNESSDDTVKVAKQYGATVYGRKNNMMLNVNKNYGFSRASGDWILCLDDDEVIPKDLADEIHSALSDCGEDTAGFWIARKNIIFGKWIRHGIWWPDRQLRLFRRGKGIFPQKHVHEYIEVEGSVHTLTHPFVHYNYDSLAQYLSKMQNIYTDSEVDKYVSAGYKIQWVDALRFPLSDFLKLYFAQNGYRDGLHGLVLAGLQAFYSFIIFIKLWEREKFPETDIQYEDIAKEIGKAKKETAYWTASIASENADNGISRIWYRVLRRFSRP